MRNILTLEQAKFALRLDEDANDEELLSIISSASDYLYNATGKRWEDDELINATAIAAAKILLNIEYNNLTDELTNTRLTAKIKQLQMLAISEKIS